MELLKPNPDLGLVRARYNIAVLTADRSVITVLGDGGLPGTIVSTIYQLPPGGIYGGEGSLPGTTKVASVEYSAIDRLIDWNRVTPAVATVTGAKMTVESGFVTITGRVKLDKPGKFNVIVQGFLKGPSGRFALVRVGR